MRYFFLVGLLIGFINVSFAQADKKIELEFGVSLKPGIGQVTFQNIRYRPGVGATVLKQAVFDNPPIAASFAIYHKLGSNFAVGAGGEVNVVKYQRNPVIGDEYYDKVFFPVSIRGQYRREFIDGLPFLAEVRGGYIIANDNFANSPDGFFFIERGRLMGGASLGVTKRVAPYTLVVKAGYEILQFSREDSFGWIPDRDGTLNLTYDDKVFYNYHYHVLNISVGIVM
ncbi:MAG: hypothetical protein AAGI38_07340 [Bacteroidota bacterium]